MAASKASFFCLGLGIGACFGLLIAPKKGREIREQLLTGVSEGREYAKRRSGELADQAEEILNKGKTTASVGRDQLAAALEAGRKAYRKAVETDTPAGSGASSE